MREKFGRGAPLASIRPGSPSGPSPPTTVVEGPLEPGAARVTGAEVTWSHGEAMDAAVVADAFGIAPSQRAALQRDVAPVTSKSGGGLLKPVVIFVVLVILIMMLSECGSDDCDRIRSTFGEASTEYQQCVRNARTGFGFRTGGGSFGGFSSGGGHK